jgi:tryptophan synthase alpha chain
MNKIDKVFQKTKPFIGYLTGGDGGVDYTVDSALALINGGVDILEIGFPFSDPIADGPVIQRAHERALKHGTTSSNILEIAAHLRKKTDIPLVLFSYFNPILQKGIPYLHQLKSAGFDAVLIVDLAVQVQSEHPEPFFHALNESQLLPILLATPSTDHNRLVEISKVAKGFLYYASQKGTTGIRSKLSDDFSSQLTRLKRVFQIPIVAGFGIADRLSAQAVLEHADGFVVGSAFVQKIGEKVSPKQLENLAQSIDPGQRLKRG